MSSTVVGLVRLARPRQWVKNVLVFAAPGAAGVLDDVEPLVDTLLAFVALCLVASGTYYLNDARDVDADRLHPTKRNRPVADGSVPVGLAVAGGIVLGLAGIALGFAVRPELGITIVSYAVLTTAYSTVLKHVAVLDVVAIAAGFVLRAIAGATATGVPISEWFFIVTSFGALFVVVGKRGAEARELEDLDADELGAVRPTLRAYTPGFLAYLRNVATSGALLAYCLWAFERAELTDEPFPWYQVSIIPFAMGLFRYALVLEQGRGAAPEEVVLSDRVLQLVGVVWAVTFAFGVYTA